MKHKPELDNRDHLFSKYLYAHGWQGACNQVGATNEYINVAGKIIAIAVYNNSLCTYKVYTPGSKEARQ